MKQIIINHEELQTRAAVVQDGVLEDFFFERAQRDRLVGSIFKGKIKNLEPSLQAAFVDIGIGKNVFLHYWDMLPATEDTLEGGDDEHPEVDEAMEMAVPSPKDFRPRGHGYRRNGNQKPGGADASELDVVTQQKLVPLVSEEDKQAIKAKAAADAAANAVKPAETAAKEPGQASQSDASKRKDAQPQPQGKSNPGRMKNSGQQRGPRPKNLSGVEGAGIVPLVPEGAKADSVPARKVELPEPKKPATGFFRRLRDLLLGKKENEGVEATAAASSSKKPELLPLTDAPKASAESGAGQQGGGRKKGGQQQKQNRANNQAGGEAPADATAAKTPKLLKLPKPAKPAKPAAPSIEDIPNLFKVGQEILVQVTKGPIGDKGARVTTNLSIPGRYLVLLPTMPQIGISRRVEDHEERKRLKQMLKALTLPKEMGLIGRTAGKGLSQEDFQRDLDILLESWTKGEKMSHDKPAPVCVYREPTLVERLLRDCLTDDIDEVVTDSEETYQLATSLLSRYDTQSKVKVKFHKNPTPIFIQYHVSKQIESISDRKVPLPSGGWLCIDETEALIAIDVNSGKNHSGKDQPETIKMTNMEAVKEIARQLRLRNIGGLVILDLIDMKSRKDQQEVYKAFREYLSADRARIKTYPISNLGLIEMSRQRESESLEAQMFDDCPYCHGRGLIKNSVCISAEIQRRLHELLGKSKNIIDLEITVHPTVLERLKKDRKIMESMAAEYNRRLTFKPDDKIHIEEFIMTDLADGKKV